MYEQLETIDTDGHVPSTRMGDYHACASRVQMLLRADRNGRSQRRALVKGLVDGNPPYRHGDLVKAGRAYACNVNWRSAESYLNTARTAFFDVYSEADTYATITTSAGNPHERKRWSNIISEEFDRLLSSDDSWDYVNEISQYEMVLYGIGPIIFCDATDWRNESVLCRELLVPEYTKSDPSCWEECAVLKDYRCDELYAKIVNSKVAGEIGWNVQAVRKAIMDAHPRTESGGQYGTWEWHQQQLKNRALEYSAESRAVPCAHYFFKEFPNKDDDVGRITHCIIVNPDNESFPQAWLFRHERRFGSFTEIVHPLYYDNDGGGYHHSVTGLGVKMYSALEYQNRLMCNLADKAFAPKLFFKAMSASGSEKLNLITWGDYAQFKGQYELQQFPTGSFIEDGLVFSREVTSQLASNLSQYKTAVSKESGNPITATEMEFRASEQARLGKTQLAHYYKQMDRLYREKYRRASNPNLPAAFPGAKAALAFQQRCVERGVPKQALRQIEHIQATRIIGQGSQFMRQAALEKLIGTLPIIPSEQGRQNIISDFIAALAGQGMVDRYNPQIEVGGSVSDQTAFATLQVAAAKQGVPPVVGSEQNHMVFAGTFLDAASQAVSSLEQGGDMMAVYQFIEAIGPALLQHIQALETDPTRKQIAKAFMEQFKQLTKIHDQLGKTIQKQQQQQAEQMQMRQRAQALQNGTDPELQLQAAESQAKLAIKSREKAHSMQIKQAQANQKMLLTDRKTAQDLALADAKTAADIALRERSSGDSENDS